MNLLRKSSMILLGTAAAGLLAFACADNGGGTGGDTADISSAPAKALLISQVYGGGGGTNGLDGDFVELFNPTESAVKLDGLALQTSSAGEDFVATKMIKLDSGDTKEIASGHYFLVSLTPKATFGLADGKKADLVAADKSFSLNATSGSVVLLKAADACGDSACAEKALSLVGFGKDSDGTIATAAGNAPAPAPKNSTEAVLRIDHGCTDFGSNAKDFVTGAPTPRTSADGFDCSKIAANNGADAGEDSGADAAASDAGKDSGTVIVKKDAGPKPDAATTSDDGSDDGSDDDGTPAATTGVKKKTNVVNSASQPIATSSPSCSTSSGPASAGGFAGLAGIGLALSALGRRRNRNK